MKTQPRHLGPEAVATAAYYEWLNAGQPAGRDQEFWLAAEGQLRRQFQTAENPTSAPAPANRKPTKARIK